MAKRFMVLTPQQPCSSGTHLPCLTDWDQCVLCQKDTSEKLCCPAESSRGDLGSGYQTIADNLLAFSNIGCLPKNIDLDKLDDGEGIQATFEHHRARWHDSCRLEYNKTKLFRAEKRKTSCERRTDVPRKYTRQSVDQPQPSVDKCFFCDGQAGKGTLHEASTFEIDANVRKCALKLEDKRLLAKLSGGDLIAQEAKYHATCLTSLYNKARDTKLNEDPDQDAVNQGIALAELVSYIEEARMDSDVAPVFKLIDLATLYKTRLEQLGTVLTGRVHTTELKNRILRYFPNLEEHKRGRDILLAFNEDVGAALRMACEQDADSDGIHLARAANIVRRDMLKMTTAFSGSFDTLCQEESVPNSLIALVSMILNGPNIHEQSSHSSIPAPTLTISQLLQFNSCARRRKSTGSVQSTKHSHNRETPVPVYLGVMIHTKTRRRDLVDELYRLGLSVAYDRVLSISSALGDNICSYFQLEGAVCPPKLKGGLFTTGAVDNIDHNPSSTSAQDSFHGTGISLFQHPNSDVPGVQRIVDTDSIASTATTVVHLPESYTSVPPVILRKRDPPVPKLAGPNRSESHLIPQAMETEYR